MFFFFPLALPQRRFHDPPSMRLPSPHCKFLQQLLFFLHHITTTAAAASTATADNVSCINNNNSEHLVSTYSVLDAMLSDLLWGLLKMLCKGRKCVWLLHRSVPSTMIFFKNDTRYYTWVSLAFVIHKTTEVGSLFLFFSFLGQGVVFVFAMQINSSLSCSRGRLLPANTASLGDLPLSPASPAS